MSALTKLDRELTISKIKISIIIKHYRLSHDVVTCDVIATFRLHTASLHQAMRSTDYASPYKARCSAVIGWFTTALIGAFRNKNITDNNDLKTNHRKYKKGHNGQN